MSDTRGPSGDDIARAVRDMLVAQRAIPREQYALLVKNDGGDRCSTRFGPVANAALLLAVVALLVGSRVGRDAARCRDLTLACVATFVVVLAALYLFSARRLPGALGGLTPDDYRLSAAMDFAPATEIALVGFSASVDLLPVIEWTRPHAGLVAARVGLAAATAASFVWIAGTPSHAFPQSHDLWSLATFSLILGYAGTVAGALGGAALWGLWALLIVDFALALGGLGMVMHRGSFALLTIAEFCFIATLAVFLITAAYSAPGDYMMSGD